ncbi:MAG: hypothetical protein B6D39_02945 [Anaerolineae bacterium UTCFX2]|jgi:hypothetical protein|nr:hypothetical protein [Anaerolineales bacterium]OQY93519.1 MAG: hypothetical protein B6D39_02945 [Anaerolineae bacterium UTCFX2]
MTKIRILFVAAVLIAVLIPVAASAAGVFYCSTLIGSGGNGTYAFPWACSTNAQLQHIINDIICQTYRGGHLYQIFSGYYVHHSIVWVGTGQTCTVTSTEYRGYPPNTGVDLPLPLILAAVAVAGVALVGAGMMLKRKSAS